MSTERKFNRKRYNRNNKKFQKYRGVSLAEKKYVNSMITKRLRAFPEKKYLDEGWGDAPIPYSGYTLPVSFVPQGATVSQRIGEQIKLQSLFYRYVFTLGDASNIIRFVIIQINEEDSGLATIIKYSELFQYSTTDDPTNNKELMSPLRIKDRTLSFNVLMDKHIILDANKPTFVMEGFINKFKRENITFSTSGFGVGNIYVCAWSDSTAAAHPLMSGYSRIRYTDA